MKRLIYSMLMASVLVGGVLSTEKATAETQFASSEVMADVTFKIFINKKNGIDNYDLDRLIESIQVLDENALVRDRSRDSRYIEISLSNFDILPQVAKLENVTSIEEINSRKVTQQLSIRANDLATIDQTVREAARPPKESQGLRVTYAKSELAIHYRPLNMGGAEFNSFVQYLSDRGYSITQANAWSHYIVFNIHDLRSGMSKNVGRLQELIEIFKSNKLIKVTGANLITESVTFNKYNPNRSQLALACARAL